MTMTNAEWCLKNNINFTELTVRNKKSGGYGIKNVSTGKDIDTYMAKNKGTGFEIFRRWLDAEHDEPILDDAEKRYLSAVIRPFRDRVEWIAKVRNRTTGKCYIEIATTTNGFDEDIVFPYFDGNEMYKGMKLDKTYTLEELGL